MIVKKLGDIADVIAGQSPASEYYNKDGKGLPFFQGKADFGFKYPTVRSWVTNPIKLALPNDILISVRAPVGPTNICNVTSCIGRGLSAIRVKPKYSNEYLYYFLKSIENKITKSGVGSTFGSITQNDIKNISVTLLETFEEQKEIASTLYKAENLILKRQETLSLLDDFLKSKFFDMFGDPANNVFLFPKIRIREIVAEIKYGTSQVSSDKGVLPYLRMNNITSHGYVDYSSLKYITIPNREKEKYIVKYGDILFNRTNSKELVGKTAIFERSDEMVIAGYIIKLKTNEKANPYYLWGYLNSQHGKRTLYGMCKNIVGMANINAQELQDITILLPPKELQDQFAKIAKKVNKIKIKQEESLNVIKELYQSLLQRAFDKDSLSKIIQNEKINSSINYSPPKSIDFLVSNSTFKDDSPLENKKSHTSFEWEEFIIVLKKRFKNKSFTFSDMIIVAKENFDDDETHFYEFIKKKLFIHLEQKNALIEQIFEDSDKGIEFKIR